MDSKKNDSTFQSLAGEHSHATAASSAPSNTSNETTKKAHRKGLNMAMLGKSDLLQLLSILEGELEARDVYIASLQAQLHQDSYSKQRYFHHNISDPFMALMRDNEAVSGSVTPCQECHPQQLFGKDMQVKIEPLPLLDKVVTKFRKQQEKVKQHMALNRAYFNMVNSELQEEMRKRHQPTAADAASAGASTKEEMEKLQALAQTEKAKATRIESEYMKLLQLVTKERQRYRTIITMLLDERSRTRNSEHGNNSGDCSLQRRISELTLKNAELESSLLACKESELKMRRQVEQLFEKAKRLKLNIETKEAAMQNNSSGGSGSFSRTPTESPPPYSANAVRRRHLSQPEYETPLQSPFPMQADLERDGSDELLADAAGVSVKRSSSVIEKKVSRCKADETSCRESLTNVGHRGNQRKLPNSLPGNARSGDKAPLIVSSPTSGAADFALNSPNEPHARFPLSAQPPRAAHRPSSAPSALTSSANPFHVTRHKFPRAAKPPCAVSPDASSGVSAEGKGTATAINNEKDDSCLPSVPKATSPSLPKKQDGGVHKPQPPKPPKSNQIGFSQSQNGCSNGSVPKARPPPLPPKKPNILPKKSSTKLPARPNHGKDEPGKTGSGPPPERGSRVSVARVSVAPNSKLPAEHHKLTNKGSAKRPTSLNTNANNNHTMPKRPGALQLSAQQRLFLQDETGTHMRSPITHTVPKSPLEPSMFTFK